MEYLIEQLQAIAESEDLSPNLKRYIDGHNTHKVLDWKDEAGNCVLHLCVGQNRLDCLKQLLSLLQRLPLDSVSYVNGTNHYGRSPLQLASFYGFDPAVKLLLSFNGTEIDKQTNAGCTSLYFACCRNHATVVNLLLASGANPNVHTATNSTALMAATVNGNIPVVKALLDNGACSDLQNSEGKTALHVAAETNNKKVMELLISYGANIAIEDRLMRTPNDVLQSVQEEASAAGSSIALQATISRPHYVGQTRRCKIQTSASTSETASPSVDGTRHLAEIQYRFLPNSAAFQSRTLSTPCSQKALSCEGPSVGRCSEDSTMILEERHPSSSRHHESSRRDATAVAASGR